MKIINIANTVSLLRLFSVPIILIMILDNKLQIAFWVFLFASITDIFESYQFVIGGIKSIDKEKYNELTKHKNVKVVFNQTYNLLANAKAAIVTSGTASLEAAIFKIPQVVCYKTSFITYLIGKMLVNIKYISLVNLILNDRIVNELVQGELNSNNLKNSINKILKKDNRLEMINAYNNLINMLYAENPSRKTAELIVR